MFLDRLEHDGAAWFALAALCFCVGILMVIAGMRNLLYTPAILIITVAAVIRYAYFVYIERMLIFGPKAYYQKELAIIPLVFQSIWLLLTLATTALLLKKIYRIKQVHITSDPNANFQNINVNTSERKPLI